jgi:eukaryotic-like serine/threonine-protein kinase
MPQLERASEHDRLMSLVDAALAQPPGEREDWLRRECGGDSRLFDQAREYIELEERMGAFLLEPFCTLELFDPAFEPGEVLEDRFRIIRKVGEGGMAIVYEATDETLNKRIAVKCAKVGFGTRLTPEVRHAREIAHRNVCKIFDFHSAGTDHGEIDFVTMEFLDGPTLTERLRDGPLPEREARDIALQLCAGLAAAHRNQVIHGDLKSNNVILTKATDGTSRAVITDFGLARGIQPQVEDAPPGGFGSAVGGASEYMAPELWRGEKPSLASDIYALGVICHEMLTGRRVRAEPLRVHPKWNGILARCLAPRWNGILARCLAQDPALRYQSVKEIEHALAPSIHPWMLAAAGVVLAAAVGEVTYLRTVTPPETARLAVLPFETDAPNRALSDGLLNETAVRLRHVKGNRRIRLTVIPLADAAQSKVDQPAKAAKLLGATHVLSGIMQWDSGRLILRAALSDTHSQFPLKEWHAEYALREVRNAPVFLAGMVAGALRLPSLAPTAIVSAPAYADFTKGVGLLQRNDGAGALPFLERAVRADSDSPLTHAALAGAELLQYQLTREPMWQDRAIASLVRARQRSPGEPEVLLVSSMLHESLGEYETARDDVSRVLEMEPQNGDALRRLGAIYVESNHPGDALAAYRKAADVQPGHMKNYQGLCYVYKRLGDYQEAIPQCQNMVAAAPESSPPHLALAGAYWGWGDYAGMENESRIALSLDPQSPMGLQILALALTHQGRYSDAIYFFQRARDNGSPTYLLYLNLGTTYRWANLADKASESYRDGIKLAEVELARNSRDAAVRSDLAYMHAWLHESDQARSAASLAFEQAQGSTDVIRMLIMTYVALGEHERSWELVSSASRETVRRLTLEPDLAEFRKNPRFQRLMATLNIH